MSKSEIFDSTQIGNLTIDENNPNSASAENNSEARGLFVIPSTNVPGRPSDISGYVLTAGNKDGKIEWAAGGGSSIDLGDLANVDTTGAVAGNVIKLNGIGLWVAETAGGLPAGSDTEIQFNSGGSAFGATSNLTWTGSMLNVTGTINATTVSTASLTMSGTDLLGLSSVPPGASSAASKAYVDSVAGSGVTWKDSVRAATTAATTDISLSGSIANMDGITDLITGNRVLVKNQDSNQTLNGLYIVNTTGAWSRTSDFDTGAKASGAAVFVTEGTDNGDKGFVCTSDEAVVGDILDFTEFTNSAGTPGTPVNSIQFNNAGTFGGSANLTYVGSTLISEGSVKTNTSFIMEDPAGSNTVTLEAPTLIGDYTLTFPVDNGTLNQVLTTDGNGELSWSTVAGSPAGSNAEIQFNNSGSFGANANLTWNGSGVNIGGTLTSTGVIRTDTSFIMKDPASSNTVTLEAPTLAGDYTLTFPVNDGTANNQVLTTNGSGLLSWAAPVVSAIAPDNAIQFNSGSNTLAGSGDLTWDTSTLTVTGNNVVTGTVQTGTGVIIDDPGIGSDTVTLQSPTLTDSYTLTLPVNAGDESGEVLATNGSGVLSWVRPTSSYKVSFIDATYTSGNPYVPTAEENLLVVTGTSTASIVINLPLISSLGKAHYNVLDKGACGTNGTTITINRNVADNLYDPYDPSDTIHPFIINADYNSIELVNDSVDGWFIY